MVTNTDPSSSSLNAGVVVNSNLGHSDGNGPLFDFFGDEIPGTNPIPPPFLNAHLGPSGCLRAEWIDVRLAPFYQKVVNLPLVTLVPATDDAPSDDDDYLRLTSLLRGLDPNTTATVLACLNFTHWGAFVNPSRVAPIPLLHPLLTDDGKIRSVPAQTSRNISVKTVYNMVGKIDTCALFSPRLLSFRDNRPRYIREVKVVGVQQEAQSLAAHMGALFDSSIFACNCSNGVFAFRTFPQLPTDPPNVSPTVPLSFSNGDPSDPYTASNELKRFPHFKDPMPFPHTVPIFDGRPSNNFPAFTAQPWQLSRIGQRLYPLYNNGNTDLPRNSIVSVGFTAHRWTPATPVQGLSVCLSLCISYLVLLALPPSDPTPSTSSSSVSLNDDNIVHYEDLYH
ncbi:hypothetical protein EV361DRAFT_925059 [Lentinula raphanica]|nr:hypothetical protein EV361DRAFT_925059 [Lentinula raphanica]